MEVREELHVPAALSQDRTPYVLHMRLVWTRVAPEGFGEEKNALILPGFEFWTVQPVVQ